MGGPDRLLTIEPAFHRDLAAELLADLSHQRCPGGLTRLDLAARKLPPSGDGGRSRTPGSEETPVAHDRAADDERRSVAHGASVVAAAGARGAFAVAPGTASGPRSSRGTPICCT